MFASSVQWSPASSGGGPRRRCRWGDIGRSVAVEREERLRFSKAVSFSHAESLQTEKIVAARFNCTSLCLECIVSCNRCAKSRGRQVVVSRRRKKLGSCRLCFIEGRILPGSSLHPKINVAPLSGKRPRALVRCPPGL